MAANPLPSPEDIIQRGARTLVAVARVLPRRDEISLEHELAACAQARGYFLPDEDDRIRQAFARYLHARAALHLVVRDGYPLMRGREDLPDGLRLRAFAVTYTAGCMLYRAGRFIVDTYGEHKVVRAKLDEPEPRLGIPAGMFTTMYRNLVRTRNLMRFYRAARFAAEHRQELALLARDPALREVVELLRDETPFAETQKRYYTGRFLHYRLHRIERLPAEGFRRVMFGLFRISGRVISEMRNPFHRKRVRPAVLEKLRPHLRPGDVIITRHDDALSNLFLPGYWPHGALYIGSEEERRRMGVLLSDERWARSAPPVDVLEAKKDGVRFRPLAETLTVDAFTVLRPRLPPEGIAQAVSRAAEHEGKLYDFEFDFTRSNMLVCTEVIYRAYHGLGEIAFTLANRQGRFCLPAEDLITMALTGRGFDIVAAFGVERNRLLTGDAARACVERNRARRPDSR